MANRPLSPHLGIWKWGPHMLVSILHRATGDGLALVGVPVFIWWLGVIAAGPEAYANFAEIATSIPGYIVLVGVSWAFFNHLASGIRHFVMDLGAGYELKTNRRWSVGSILSGLVLTVAFWAAILL